MSREQVKSAGVPIAARPYLCTKNAESRTTPIMTSGKPPNWFSELFGFSDDDGSYSENQRHFHMEGEELVCENAPFPRQHVGPWETPSLAELRERHPHGEYGEDKLTFRHLATTLGVGPLILDPSNAGAVFMVASQFNALEMISPDRTPSDGVAIYARDRTQGPVCAMACPAATVFRNYLCQDGVGQGEKQLDLLAGVGNVVGNIHGRYWTMRNGYAMPTKPEAFLELSRQLRNDKELCAAAESALRVGVHAETQVKPPLAHRVAQVFCSALPVAYCRDKMIDELAWEPFARLVLRAAYEATLAIGVGRAALSSTGRAAVFLTAIGDGAFGNNTAWVREALVDALDKYRTSPLDVTLVHYGSSVAEGWLEAGVPERLDPPAVHVCDPAAEARARFASTGAFAALLANTEQQDLPHLTDPASLQGKNAGKQAEESRETRHGKASMLVSIIKHLTLNQSSDTAGCELERPERNISEGTEDGDLVRVAHAEDQLMLHALVRAGDAEGITNLHASLSAAKWERALCQVDGQQETPLSFALGLGNVAVVSALLDLGAARSVFVHEYKSETLLCTLRRKHAPTARAEDLSDLAHAPKMLAAIDEALESYITNLADGCVKFAWRLQDDLNSLPHVDGASDALDHTPSVKGPRGGAFGAPPATAGGFGGGFGEGTGGGFGAAGKPFGATTSAGASSLTQASLSASRDRDPAAVFERGDLVSLIRGLPGSTCLISTRNTYNSPACSLCLGAASLGRVGIVIGEAMQVASLSSGGGAVPAAQGAFGGGFGAPTGGAVGARKTMQVASLSSGVVCEYAVADLQFADGSSLTTAPPVLPTAPAASNLFRQGDRVRVKAGITPKSGWGKVKKTSVGMVQEYDAKTPQKVRVAFKSDANAEFLESELEWVFRVGDFVKGSNSAAKAAAKAAAAAAATAAQQNRAGAGNENHPHVTCDECGASPIKGPRWKCKTRSGFDLCDKCYVKHQGDSTYTYQQKIGDCTQVQLTKDYAQYGDAGGGPLKPGQVGVVIKNDGSNGQPFKVRASNGKEWWYHKQAIEAVAPTRAATVPVAASALPHRSDLPKEQLLIVTSAYPVSANAPQRGIVVSSLDLLQHYVVTGRDIAPARCEDYAKIRYRKGDLVQLFAQKNGGGGGEGADDRRRQRRSLGAPADKRWGVVLNPGVLRGGIQRNMVVAAESEGEGERARADVGLSEKRETEREAERDRESRSEVRVSLYSSIEVMPYARSGLLTAADAASLTEEVEGLNYALVRAVQSPELLVRKFGASVFCKLWALFHKNQAYDLALEAFLRWQASRKQQHLLSAALKALLDEEYATLPLPLPQERERGEGGGRSDDEGAGARNDGDRHIAESYISKGAFSEAISNWLCSACFVENDKSDIACQVCGTRMPTWTCAVCLCANNFVIRSCEHCQTPQPALARLRRKLLFDPKSAFARADVDGSADLSFSEWSRAFADEVIDEEVLRGLFEELDTDGDGRLSFEEFREGLALEHEIENDEKSISLADFARERESVAARPRTCVDSDNLQNRIAGSANPRNKIAGGSTALAAPGKIKVYVAYGDERTPFRIKRTTPLQRVVNKYCKQRGFDMLDMSFLFQGKEMQTWKTADELAMDNPSTILCVPDTSFSHLNSSPAPLERAYAGAVAAGAVAGVAAAPHTLSKPRRSAASLETTLVEGCRVQIHSLPHALSCYNGKAARVLSTDTLLQNGHCLCEIGMDGDIELASFRPDNLQRLPGLPTNWRMQQQQQAERAEAFAQTCWRVGALVSLMPRDKTPAKKQQAGDPAGGAATGTAPGGAGADAPADGGPAAAACGGSEVINGFYHPGTREHHGRCAGSCCHCQKKCGGGCGSGHCSGDCKWTCCGKTGRYASWPGCTPAPQAPNAPPLALGTAAPAPSATAATLPAICQRVEVSTNDARRHFLTDGNTGTYWQSDGSRPHWIRLHLEARAVVTGLWIQISLSDWSYCPSLVDVLVGDTPSDLKPFKSGIQLAPTGLQKCQLLDKAALKHRIVQINVCENYDSGCNSKVYGVFLEGHASASQSAGGLSVGSFDGLLAAGRGLQSVGCVKSVNLDAKTVEVVVVQGHEMLLSHTTPQIGQLVRLATGYAGGSDAHRGPLQPGETATIVAVEDGLVLVQPCKVTCIANADAAVKAAEGALARGDIAAARAAQEEYTGEYSRIGEEGRSKLVSVAALTEKIAAFVAAAEKAAAEKAATEKAAAEAAEKAAAEKAAAEKAAAEAAEKAAVEKAAPTVGSAPAFGASTGGAFGIGSAQAFASTGGAFGAGSGGSFASAPAAFGAASGFGAPTQRAIGGFASFGATAAFPFGAAALPATHGAFGGGFSATTGKAFGGTVPATQGALGAGFGAPSGGALGASTAGAGTAVLTFTPDKGQWAVSDRNKVYVRDGPSKEAKVIGNIEPGTVVSAEGILSFVENRHTWLKLGENRYMMCYNGDEGYNCMQRMTFTPNEGQWVVVHSQYTQIRVRDGPSLKAKEITAHSSGTVVSAEGIVTVEGSDHRWIKLGENRYMMAYNADERRENMQQQVWKWTCSTCGIRCESDSNDPKKCRGPHQNNMCGASLQNDQIRQCCNCLYGREDEGSKFAHMDVHTCICADCRKKTCTHCKSRRGSGRGATITIDAPRGMDVKESGISYSKWWYSCESLALAFSKTSAVDAAPVDAAPASITVCGTGNEDANVTMTAPTGTVFTSVEFASYGTPTGTCGAFSIGTCHATNSVAVVSGFLIGNGGTISIPATNAVFTDPCFGTMKRLYIQATACNPTKFGTVQAASESQFRRALWDHASNPGKQHVKFDVDTNTVTYLPGSPDYCNILSATPITQGKHSFEFVMHKIGDEQWCGVTADPKVAGHHSLRTRSRCWTYYCGRRYHTTGKLSEENRETKDLTHIKDGDVIGLIVDFELRTLIFSRNNEFQAQCTFPSDVATLYLVTELDETHDCVELRYVTRLADSSTSGGGKATAAPPLPLTCESIKVTEYSMENLRVICRQDTASIPKVYVSPQWSKFLHALDTLGSEITPCPSDVPILHAGCAPNELKFVHKSDFDTNGLLYYIGSEASTREWVNPATEGRISVTSSDGPSLAYGRLEDIVSRESTPQNCHTKDQPTSWFAIDLGVWIWPSAYTLRHSTGYGKAALRTWQLEASKDGSSWQVLLSHQNDTSLQEPGSTHTWNVEAPTEAQGWRHVRILQTGPNADNRNFLSLSGFEIYGSVKLCGVLADLRGKQTSAQLATQRINEQLEVEEDLQEETKAPALESGFEERMTQKMLESWSVKKKRWRGLSREESYEVLWLPKAYDVIDKLSNLVGWRDRFANSVAHHLAYAGLDRALKAVFNSTKSLKWAANKKLETPMMIADGLAAPSGGLQISRTKTALHLAIRKGDLFKVGSSGFKNDSASSIRQQSCKLIGMAMRCPDDLTPKGDLGEIIKCLQTPGQAAMALNLASKSSDAHASIYSACAMLDLNMGIKQVSIQIDRYLQLLLASTDKDEYVDPMLYYVFYYMWKKHGTNRRSERVSAGFALTALRCFPVFAESWVDAEDDVDAKVKAQGLMEEDISEMDDDDDLDEVVSSKDAPETEWQLAKADHNLRAEAMDKLMALTGLRDIKRKAIGVVKEVLLQKGRPASVKAEISMNFLFTGNPGCGKTTVAQLLAKAMNQLGFRKNPLLVETSAQDILKSKDPGSDFANMMKNATGGCLFIDEAYRFSPSPAGQQPNASNEVLDYLLEAVEKPEIRSSTTVILAGYKDEIETLLAYNVGFASRFNKEFSFPDYTEAQLRKIFVGMVKDRGFQLERKKDCGVSLSAVIANRIHRGAGKKGFGNAREVRNQVEEVIAKQSDRLGTMRLQKKPVAERDYKILLAVDTLGVRPDFSRSPVMRELEAMVGLNKVKEQFRNLLMMATQNFDREKRGEKANLISLHRVFYGNPGTGKTTVSMLYGALLKELGYLSKGDFISVTPADLTGDHQGGASTATKAVLEKAKGKVLLIDEAYILDPKRKNNIYGGNVLDTLVEKLDGDAGSDCAVVLAGYRQEMFDMLENNPGLRRRFNIDDFGIEFEDMEDDELRQVLVSGVAKAGLAFSNMADIDAVIARIAQKRRLPGFGNAGAVNSMINLAKSAKSKRIGEAQKAYDTAIKEGRVPEPMPNPDVLLRSDFIQNEADAASARDAFANLYNMDHIQDVLDELEAIILQSKADGREPADVLADSHMVFVGPPGTGKTTVASKFGKLLKDLNILPSDHVTMVTGNSLQGQYTGETKEKVLKVMHQARGGILFIDEAYGMGGGQYSSNPYAKEAIDTLVGTITQPEFKGNMLVIMAGYEDSIDQMFASVNPGFASRFNKRRVKFLAWTAQQAVNVVVEEIQREKRAMTEEAIRYMRECCIEMQPLPSWGSARDVFETIIPALFSQRAKRLVKTQLQGAVDQPAYELQDVQSALRPILVSRMKMLGYDDYIPP